MGGGGGGGGGLDWVSEILLKILDIILRTFFLRKFYAFCFLSKRK